MTSDTPVAPAFDRCTPMQRLFVMAYITSGALGAQSIRAAGYKGKHAGQQAAKMLARPHVREAIRDMSLKVLDVELVAQALNTVQYLSVHAKSESVRLQAAQDILNRAKLSVPEHEQHRTPGKVVISFQVPSIDGTHSNGQTEGGGVENSPNPQTSIPQPRTIEGSFETVKDDDGI